MQDLRFLHELDRSVVSVVKDYAHPNNFPEFIEILKELELIEKEIDKGYSDVGINNSELSNMINNQNDIRINLNEKLTRYDSKSDKENLFAEIKNLINNYINNYNSIREYIKNNATIDAKKDTI
ncbi:MAG: hypothetical protein HS049_03130 [Thaumarchaeota archaeon]|nr:hypothetical protein [Nitrososphaerota archaeon]